MFDIKFTMFFDKPGVLRHVANGTKSVLAKAGAFVRRRARSSIRKRRRIAEPGSPPSSHTGRLRDLIFFAYDAITASVVIGPLLFRRRTPTVPLLLEKGGGPVALDWRPNKPATYNKFPFMEPAERAERPKFPGLFTDAIK